MVKNGKALIQAQRFFGLHFAPGIAEYTDPTEGKPYRIFLNENVTKAMDSTFEGKPVYVQHVDEVNQKNVQHEAAGRVVRSFFNQLDGMHWAEFLIETEEGQAAIKRGYRLSNAYLPSSYAQGGTWHNVKYEKEVTGAEFEHLALVDNPRYEESVIMTPEEFKAYNAKKESELMKFMNDKSAETAARAIDTRNAKPKGAKSMKFWNRKEVEAGADLENTMVALDDGRNVTIAQLVNAANTPAKPETVKIGEETLTLAVLAEKYTALLNAKKNDEDEEEDEDEKKKKKENAEEDEEEEKKKKAEKNKNSKDIQDLLDAGDRVENDNAPAFVMDKTAIGKSRYGS